MKLNNLLALALVALFASSALAVVEQSYLQWPETGTEQPNSFDLTVYSRVLKTGCTGSCDSTECADLEKVFYYRAQGETEYTATTMDLNVGDCYDPEDEYASIIPVSAMTGDSVFFYAEFSDLDGVVDYTSAPGSEGFTFTAEEPAYYVLVPSTTVDFSLQITGDFHCVTPSGQGPGISGTFNGWTYESMTSIGDGLYTYDVLLPAGSASTIQFKFRNGTDWETLAGGPFANRSFEVPLDATEGDYFAYWNDEEECPCEEFPLMNNQQVIFSVDMNYQDPASYAGGVSIQGSRAPLTWNAGEMPMADVDGDGVYTLSVTFTAGTINSSDYKFTKSADGAVWEWENNLPGNRFLCMPDNFFMVAPVHVFDDYVPAPGITVPVDVTFQVDLGCLDPADYAGGVSIQGNQLPLDFNEGSMLMNGVDSFFDITITFPVGTPFDVEYKFNRYDLATEDWVWEWDGEFVNRMITLSDDMPVMTVGPLNWEDWICPTDVTISYNAGQVTLAWDAVPGADSYNVYSDVDCYGLFDSLEGNTGETYLTLPAIDKVCYKVRAVSGE